MMSYENLTRKQQDLLRWMVQIAGGTRELGEFRGMRDNIGNSSNIFLIAPDGDERIVNLDILKGLDQANLISLRRYSRKQGSTIVKCSLRELAFEAVQNGFKKLQSEAQTTNLEGVSIGSITISGGQAIIGEITDNKFTQIVNDPQKLELKVDELTNQIVEEVKKSLNYDEGVIYIKEVSELRKELLSEKPEPSKIKKLISNIGFLGDIGGTVDLIEKVWPLLLQLFVLFQNMQL